MRVTWRETPRFGHAEVFALIGALSFIVARFLPVLALPFVCPFRGLTGLPCASCGMTHAFVHLAHGQLAEALRASPLGALGAAAAWSFAALDLARAALGLPVPVPSIAPGIRRRLLWLVPAALVANWAFLVAASGAR